jgi:Protein of unknown function (DUF1638)
MSERQRVLVIACGALVRELRVVLDQLGDKLDCTVEYLPAQLHNRPEGIPARIREIIDTRAEKFDRVLVGYADCGTGGLLDAALKGTNAVRLPGAHCYEFFAGQKVFDAWHEAELGTFYLTDFLVRNFDALIMGGLGIDRHSELRDMYFGNYRRVLLLTQSDDPELITLGVKAAEKLGLAFEHHHVGLDPFRTTIDQLL